MKITHEYIKFEKQDKLLLWFIKAKADILLINSTFVNSQDNKVQIIAKDKNDLKIRCPSGDYNYSKRQVLDNLNSGKYSDFTFYYNRDNINHLLIPIFNYYKNFTIASITYQNFISFYKTNSSNFLYKFLEELIEVNFDLKIIFDDYFNMNKKPSIKKWSVGTYIVFLETIGIKLNKKGDIDKIKINDGRECIILEKFKSLSYKSREQRNQIKWFATKAEAEKFSKELLNNVHPTNKNSNHNWSIPNSSKQVNYIDNYYTRQESFYDTVPKTFDECYKKSSKLNRKLLLL